MTVNPVSIKGQLRMDIPIHLDGKVYNYDQFIAKFHNWNILRGLPPIYSGGNQELTPGGAMYYNSMHLYLKRNSKGWLMVDRIVSPEPSARGAINDMIPRICKIIKFTHPHDLRHGKIATFNPYGNYKFSNPFTAGKRLRLVTGFKVKGYQPAPTRIGIPSGIQYPDGIILVSKVYADTYQLHTSSNIYHEVDIDYLGQVIEDIGGTPPLDLANRVGVSPLRTGDKIAGVLPTGHLVKGTIIIDSSQSIDMIIPSDSVKASGVPYNEYTRFSIRLRAADRLTTFNTRLSYQIGQFIPDTIAYRISTLLRVPIMSRCIVDSNVVEGLGDNIPVQDTIYKDTRAHVAGSMPESNSISNLSILDLCTSLSNKVWDDNIKSTCIDLFRWIEHDSMGGEALKSIHWAEDISNGMSPYTNSRLMTAIKSEIMIKIKKVISPPVNGAWGVATPSGNEGCVSVPDRIYNHLGRPYDIAAIRFPVKSRSSLIRLRCISHSDDDPTFHVHNDLMTYIWNGDYDGDLIQIISDPDIVSTSVRNPHTQSLPTPERNRSQVASLLNDNMSGIRTVEVGYPQLTGDYDRDLALAQVYVADWRSDVGVICNIRDNLYGAGLLDKSQCIRLFDIAFQPALAQMDGAPPIGRYLLDNPSILASSIGIEASTLLDKDGKVRRSPSPSLSAVRGDLPYDKFLEVVNEATPDNPHGILLHPFKILPTIN